MQFVLLASAALHLGASPSQWTDLGGYFSSQIATGQNADGSLTAFVRGSDNALWYMWESAPGSNVWSALAGLGGQIISNPAVATNKDGRLQVFVLGRDTAIWTRFQISPGSTNWSNWQSLGGQGQNDPAVAMNADGRLDVFVECMVRRRVASEKLRLTVWVCANVFGL